MCKTFGNEYAGKSCKIFGWAKKVENLLKFCERIAKKLWRVYNGCTVKELGGK